MNATTYLENLIAAILRFIGKRCPACCHKLDHRLDGSYKCKNCKRVFFI